MSLLQPEEHPEIAKSVVWTPIPVLSWVFPALGHVGVTDSKGVTYDFEGPYYVGRGKMIFGDPRQKWCINVDDATWDDAIEEVTQQFKHVNYNLLCSNCHYYVAAVLDRAGVAPVTPCFGRWVNGATAKVAYGLVLHGRSLSITDILVIWIPFIIIVCIFLFFVK